MKNIDYITSAYQRINSIVEQAEKNHVDLSREYHEHSKGWRLQVDLDHVGADLNLNFHGITSEERYQQFDVCLKHLGEIFKRGYFFEMMVQRRREIRRRHKDNKRVKRCITRLVDCSEDEVDELFDLDLHSK